MPTKKISDPFKCVLPQMKECRSFDHNPPSMQVFEPGTYEHTCSQCGKVSFFIVDKNSL